jgi:CMP-2-keto-3-deoxyoctulosonic acid synthetase
MVEHVFLRAAMYKGWDTLALATCDQEIGALGKKLNFPVVMTGSHHTRALDRVAEAALKLGVLVDDEDIVVCVQGDEPIAEEEKDFVELIGRRSVSEAVSVFGATPGTKGELFARVLVPPPSSPGSPPPRCH